jgi:hypothetical protein
MNAVETVKAKIKQVTSNKGNVRLFALAYLVWIAAMAWMFWQPFPSAHTQPDIFGSPRVVACLDVIVRYDRCAIFMDLITAIIAIILRAGVVFLAPLIVSLLAIIGAAIFEWISDGYSKNPPANPN